MTVVTLVKQQNAGIVCDNLKAYSRSPWIKDDSGIPLEFVDKLQVNHLTDFF